MATLKAIQDAGLRMYEVFDLHRPGSESIWAGLASSPIHALDLYAWHVDSTYSPYSRLIEDGGSDSEGYVFLYEGELVAVFENTELVARPRRAPVTGAARAPHLDALNRSEGVRRIKGHGIQE